MTAEEMGKRLTWLAATLTKWAPKEINRDLCLIWLNVLDDFTDQEINEAFVRASAELTEWPPPAAIIRFCRGIDKTDEEIGQEVSSRIEGAITRFGYSNPERAKEFIGNIGWEVVRQCGGWSRLCEIEYDCLPSTRKQWRDIGAIVSKNYFFTGKNLPPSLPKPVKRPLDLVGALKIAIGGSDHNKP